MKKRFIAMVVIVMLIATMTTACSSAAYTLHSTIKLGEQEVVGRYHLFTTGSTTEYLQFLENFNETEYEIVDISRSDGYWKVTYRNIEE